ncbi:MAG: hypothetical protein ACOH1Q_07835 [Thiobacillus sp.]
MKHAIIASICASAISFSVFAGDCFLIMCKPDGEGSNECTVSPSKMSAAMPPGLFIKEIRGYTAVAPHDDDASYTRACRKSPRLPEPVSLDQGSIYGAIFITGTVRANGVLRYEPNDGGELMFLPDKAFFEKTGPFFRREFKMLKLDVAKPQSSAHPPKSLANANCWIARATISATDFDLIVGDTSAAGNYVSRMTITNVHGFKECEWGK